MEITFRLTQTDFAGAIIAHRNRFAFMRWLYRLLIVLIIPLFGVGLWGIIFLPKESALFSYLPLLLFALFWTYQIWGAPRSAAKIQFKKQPSAQGEIALSLDPNGVQWRWDGGSSNVEWKHFIRVLDTTNHFLFYPSPVYYHVVPKSAFAAEQIAEVQMLLKTYSSLCK
jgi:hypothetical protein